MRSDLFQFHGSYRSIICAIAFPREKLNKKESNVVGESSTPESIYVQVCMYSIRLPLELHSQKYALSVFCSIMQATLAARKLNFRSGNDW